MTRTTVPPPPPPPVSDIPTIQHSAPFAGIAAAYRAAAYQDALTKVRTLARKPDLSPADRLFLQRQEEICRDALAKRTPGAIRVSPPLSVAPVPLSVAASDCGPRALFFVCGELGIPAALPALTRAAETRPGVGTNLAGLSRAANTVGLSARGVQVDADALRRAPTPALAWVDGDHFVAVTRIENDSATVHDPNKNGKEGSSARDTEEIALDTLLQRSGGVLLLLSQAKPDRVTKK